MASFFSAIRGLGKFKIWPRELVSSVLYIYSIFFRQISREGSYIFYPFAIVSNYMHMMKGEGIQILIYVFILLCN